MGMYAVLTVISDRNIQRVRKNPPLIWRYIAPDDPGAYLDAVRRPLLIRTLGRLLGRSKGSSLPDQELVDGESFTEDLDKAWHGIHYLLTGTAWEGIPPLDFLVRGGLEFPEIQVGYGSPRLFTPDQAASIHAALAPITRDDLGARFDPDDMAAQEIYPDIWQRDGGEALAYCLDHFESLQVLFEHAATHRFGVIVSVQ